MTIRMRRPGFSLPPPLFSLLLALLLALPTGWALAAKPAMTITKAVNKNGTLLVKGVNRNAGSANVDLYDLAGQLLGSTQAEGKKFSFSLTPAAIPCGVMAAAGDEQAVIAVKGAPGDCSGLTIKTAAWSEKKGRLSVKGKGAGMGSATVKLYDLDGHLLDSVTANDKGKFAFALERDKLESVPCGVRAVAGSASAAGAVAGAPAGCTAMPIPLQCGITAPAEGSKLSVGTDVSFIATVKADDPNAGALKYEWDFAGGSMGEAIPGSNPTVFKRPDSLNPTVQFARDNGNYRVRFAVTDALGQRCEAAVNVAVGTPPTGLPGKVVEVEAPVHGSELAGDKGDVVVMPFEEWTYQNLSDMRLIPNGYGSFSPVVNNVRAYAFRKDRLPVFLGPDAVELRYSAASNQADPVGSGSINSTSRNFPVGAALTEAAVQKTDMWEIPTRPDEQKAETYFACSWAMTGYWGAYGCGNAQGKPEADEGYFKAKKDENGQVVSDDPNTGLGHGAFMPGKENPYVANTPQPFSQFIATEKSRVANGTDKPASWFAANMLPFTDTDDQGRVNPFPLIRVEAVNKGTTEVVAKTDGVVTAGRDFHCRECHAKGKVAANPNAPYTKAAYASSAWGEWSQYAANNTDFGYAPRYLIAEENKPEKPAFFDVSDFGGDPNNIYDQEYAAALNYSSMHDYYDGLNFLNDMMYSTELIWLTEEQKNNPTGIKKDTPRPCYGCHATALAFEPFKKDWWDEEGFKVENPIYAPNYSISMHRWHAEMQWNTDKTDIVRDERGAHVRWDKTKGAHNSTRTGSLFPIFDDQGKQLPMEENCLKCHAGHREQLYRDRMYTAGVTCYDCHGDMMAVGEAFPKNYLANQDKLGSTERDDYRVAWFDQPDCASCHVGDGNQGADKANGFFSAGVMTRAFDDADLSATTRPINRDAANSRRFAVAPLENYRADIPTDFYYDLIKETDEWPSKMVDTKVDAPVFRFGKDRHGNVACAACHGAAHGVWPNRDPNSNDNVTALQLQGHTGTILECNVCHSSDSFAKFEDLDGGVNYSGDTQPGILGGPHDMHPVNDPYWWKEAPGDTPTTSTGGMKGGWHNNYAKLPGKNGEDQCAACHGADHKGTRLSKTPVDREFIDESGKPVGVKAGEFVGCDLCHDLNKSFTGVPRK